MLDVRTVENVAALVGGDATVDVVVELDAVIECFDDGVDVFGALGEPR